MYIRTEEECKQDLSNSASLGEKRAPLAKKTAVAVLGTVNNDHSSTEHDLSVVIRLVP